MLTAWLVGSYKDLPDQTLEVNGAPELMTGGSFYLYDTDNALSLLRRLQSALVSGGVGGASVTMLRNRKVKITGFAPFTLDWPADNLLRDLLGFESNLAASANYTATLQSPLLWSPGREGYNPEDAPIGVVGHRVPSTFTVVSPRSGRVMAITHGSRTYNRFRFPYVDADRVQTAAEDNGEWVVFFDEVAAKGFNFNLWQSIDEDDASTSAVTWTTKLGPYCYSPERKGCDWSFVRSPGFELAEGRADISLRVHVVPEYS